MFTQSKIAAIALTSSLVFASTAQTKDVSLEQYVGNMVSQVMIAAQQEINNNVREAVLNVAHNVSLNEAQSYATKVTITDLNSEIQEVSNSQAE
jgi:hypothetical protein